MSLDMKGLTIKAEFGIGRGRSVIVKTWKYTLQTTTKYHEDKRVNDPIEGSSVFIYFVLKDI